MEAISMSPKDSFFKSTISGRSVCAVLILHNRHKFCLNSVISFELVLTWLDFTWLGWTRMDLAGLWRIVQTVRSISVKCRLTWLKLQALFNFTEQSCKKATSVYTYFIEHPGYVCEIIWKIDMAALIKKHYEHSYEISWICLKLNNLCLHPTNPRPAQMMMRMKVVPDRKWRLHERSSQPGRVVKYPARGLILRAKMQRKRLERPTADSNIVRKQSK